MAKKMNTNFADIDAYIAGFPDEIRKKLNDIRSTIQKAAPRATEAIKYGIPTFILNGNLVHFAAYKNHIGLYPAPRAIEEFGEELAKYKGGKGTLQFPLEDPLPLELVDRIVKFRMKDNEARAAAKAASKKSK